MSSPEIEIFVLFKRDKSLFFLKVISLLAKSSEKDGKLSGGKHNKLKSEFSALRLILFSFFKLKTISEFTDIFRSIS